jgi:transcription-repair coupling factor (superfamily II helicase)
VRLDLFGDVLDGARRFDPRPSAPPNARRRSSFAPVSEVILDEAAITRFRRTTAIEFGAAGTDDPLYEAVSAGRKHQGMEHWLPFFHERLETLFDYLPGAPSRWTTRSTPARAAGRRSPTSTRPAARAGSEGRGRDTVYKPVPAGAALSRRCGWAGRSPGAAVQLRPCRRPPGPGVHRRGRADRAQLRAERQQENVNLFDALADHVETRRAEGPVVIASYSEGARERLATLIEDQGLEGAQIRARGPMPAQGRLHLAVWPLEQGFETAG